MAPGPGELTDFMEFLNTLFVSSVVRIGFLQQPQEAYEERELIYHIEVQDEVASKTQLNCWKGLDGIQISYGSSSHD